MTNEIGRYDIINPIQRYQEPKLNKSKGSSSDKMIDKICNKQNLDRIITESKKKYGIPRYSNEIDNFINIALEEYMKNLIENLIKISRIRNINFNIYSKMAEKSQVKTISLIKDYKNKYF